MMAASRTVNVLAKASQNYYRLLFSHTRKRYSSLPLFLQGPVCHFGGRHGNPIPFAGRRLQSGEQRSSSGRWLSTAAADQEPKGEEDSSAYHSIIKDSEKTHGDADRYEFQAETRMLLDIVAKSLYSDKEVFIRELISNASDALEKFRFSSLTGNDFTEKDRPLEIHIASDKTTNTFTIQDTGIGMTKDGLQDNLGVIARSGSKAFLKQANESGGANALTNIIGQFGVGFYSCFMVANKVDVYTKESRPDAKGYKWSSDGTGTYEILEADGVQNGTKIVLHLKPDCAEFAKEDVITGVIKKYSNFVGSPIYLNGKRANTLEALWLMDPKTVTEEMHTEFYRFVGQTYDQPRYTLHYSTDAPLSLRCLLYVPEGKPGLFELRHEASMAGLALYSRKILIMNKAENIIPKWLRFVKGVVDSEDIPLNLSRELLQDSALIRKLRTVLTNRFLRFLVDQARKDKEKYRKFFQDYGLFLKEGIISSTDQLEKEEIGKLLIFESSTQLPGEKVSIPEYCNRMKAGQRDVYYLAAPSRQLAESSPYLEAMKEKDVEVLFCYEPYDELVLLQLREFDRKNLTSVEKEMRREKEDITSTKDEKDSLPSADLNPFLDWLKNTLGNKVHQVKVTRRLSSHPCVVTVEEMGAVRQYLRSQQQTLSEEQRYKILEPILEINPSHPMIKKLNEIKISNPRLSQLIAEQIFDNAMVLAGLNEDPRTVIGRMNELLGLALEKH